MYERWTTPQDVANSWIGDDAPDTDDPALAYWIGRAERMLHHRVPDLRERLGEGDNDLIEKVVDVVVAMVTRVFRNPDQARSLHTTTGPFTATKTFAGDAPGGLTVTEDELDSLLSIPGRRRRAFSLDMIPSGSPFREA
ncbi:hypothetical protein ACUH96_00905 [Dermabacteraceae bacterium P13077]